MPLVHIITIFLLCLDLCESFTVPPFYAKSSTHHLLCSTTNPSAGTSPESKVQPSEIIHSCEFCEESFQSRNALFRHLKTSPDCSVQANLVDNQVKTIALALKFSYHRVSPITKDGDIEALSGGEILQKAVVTALEEYVAKFNTDAPVEILGSSQSSLARLRHSSLNQEEGCMAAGDNMVLRIEGPQLSFGDDSSKRDFLTTLLAETNRVLAQRSDDCQDFKVQLEACKLLSLQGGKVLHCEQMCTQRVYHYLLPLRWLPDGEDLEKWWMDTGVIEAGDGHTNKSSVRPPSMALKRMKDFLREAEAERLEGDNPISSEGRYATGRFGSLGEKKRMPWHNFSDPKLQGSASPNTKPVWRVLDRARFQLLMTRDCESREDSEGIAVLEFRGDDFLPEQIRRIVGTTLSMTHGWLPANTLDIATRSDCFVETVLAPPGRLYLVENKFHWDEMRTGGMSIFDSDIDGVSVQRQSKEIADHTIRESLLAICDSPEVRAREERWLNDLQAVICPRISKSLKEWQQPQASPLDGSDENLKDLDHPPSSYYTETLGLLRGIISSNRWPETSVARSSVIGNVKRDTGSQIYKKGSFTVINPRFRDGLYKDGVGNDSSLPLGNELFPELVQAVFDLEEALAGSHVIQQVQRLDPRNGETKSTSREVSSHCAINCNAQFTPHVDSGRGAGQSLSMIVGLGDYVGGQLGVEGVSYDIRYQPLEFDGWRLRHWTKPFEGERFSLVWFTPEMKGDEKDSTLL